MPTVDAGNYEAIKATILARYDLNTEAYRWKFRATVHRNDETNRELAVRIGEFQAKWMRECHTVEEMTEVICLEQFFMLFQEMCECGLVRRNPRHVCRQESLNC